MLNPNIFRAYDIRGIAVSETSAPPDLTEESVYIIGKATGIYLKQKYATKNMAVGRDCRLTSPALQKAFMQGLHDAGIEPIDIGLCVSPMVYFASCAPEFDFDSATNITASHNPKEYNGIKTVTKNSHSICGEELQEILKIAQELEKKEALEIRAIQGDKELPPELYTVVQRKGNSAIDEVVPDLQSFPHRDIWPIYKQALLSKVEISLYKNRPLKVVIDAGNATAGPLAPELLREADIEVVELYCDLDGNFPNHEANPEELHNMLDLIAKVKEEKADLGIGFDGDGDRVGIVDQNGQLYSSDYMLLLLARDYLNRHKNDPQNTIQKYPIVFDVKFSQIIINDLVKHGAKPIMSKTGHSFIEAKMKEINAPLAGEVSGHLFFGENYYGFDDALLAALKICEIIAKSQKPLHEHFIDLPKTFTTPEFKAYCPDDKKFQIVQNLVDHFTKNYNCLTIDGVRILFDELSWGAVRASNTTPNLTLRFEADTQEKLADIQKIMADEIKKYPEVSLDWYKSPA